MENCVSVFLSCRFHMLYAFQGLFCRCMDPNLHFLFQFATQKGAHMIIMLVLLREQYVINQRTVHLAFGQLSPHLPPHSYIIFYKSPWQHVHLNNVYFRVFGVDKFYHFTNYKNKIENSSVK